MTMLQESTMTFIERIFGLSIDNGSGSLELLVLLAPIAVLAVTQMRHKLRIRRDVSY